MKKTIATALLLILGLGLSWSATADDFIFTDCESELSRLAKEARGADNSVRSESDLKRAQSNLRDIEHRLDKAKQACGNAPSPAEICTRLTTLSRLQGKKAALDFCRDGFSFTNHGFCESCLGK